MKNRRTLFIVFAVIALAFIGVGYAALSDSVNLNVTVSGDGSQSHTNQELFDIGWRKASQGSSMYAVSDDERMSIQIAEVNEGATDAYYYTNVAEKVVSTETVKLYKELTITVTGMNTEGDYAYALLELTNAYKDSPFDAKVTVDVTCDAAPGSADDLNKPALEVHKGGAFNNDNILEEGDSFIIKNGATQQIGIKIILADTLVDSSESYEVTYTISFVAEAVNPS